MNASKLNEWLQLLTSVGVIAGLALVAYEVRQNTDFARAETVRESYSGWTEVSIGELETNISDVFIKSIEDPENLSQQEIFKLNSWYTMITSQYDRANAMHRYGAGTGSTGFSESDARYFFSSRFSRAWFEANKHWMQSDNVEVISRFIQSTPASTTWEFAEQIKSNL